MKNTRSEIFFTINIGICSQTIIQFFEPEKINQRPIIADCQLRMRIADLIGSRDDIWWSINDNTIPEQLFQEIRNILINQIIPEIEKYITDEQL